MFWPLQSPSESSWLHWNSNSQSGSSLGNVGFIFSHFPAFLKVWNVTFRLHSWPTSFATPCFSHKPKINITTSKVSEGINHEFHVKELVPIYLFIIDEKKLENVNKGSWKVKKHVEFWVKNDFNEWKIFHGFDTTKFIANILKNDFFVKDLVDMLSAFVLQVAKKNVNLYPQIICVVLPSFEFHIVVCFYKYFLGFMFFLHCLEP